MSRSKTRAAMGLLAVLLAAAGCKREPVTYSVSVSTASLPRSAPYRLVFRGTPVPLKEEGMDLRATFTAPGDQWMSEDTHGLALEVETPCGTSVFHHDELLLGRDPKGALKAIREQEKRFRPGGAPVSLGTFRPLGVASTVLVHVDRREAADKEVAIGKQVLRPGAGIPLPAYVKPDPTVTGEVYEIAAAECADGKRVRVASETVGEMGSGPGPVHALIDVKGGHCYDEVSVSYSSMPRANLPFMRPKHERRSGGRVYVFTDGPAPESTHRFLDSCPSTMSRRSSCTYVVPTACDAPAP